MIIVQRTKQWDDQSTLIRRLVFYPLNCKALNGAFKSSQGEKSMKYFLPPKNIIIAKHRLLSTKRINRLKVQGYCNYNYSDTELSALAFGNRFAYRVCLLILVIGVANMNIPILMVMTLVAFGGIILPYHPFDYIYNHIVRALLDKPKLPPRPRQIKFAFTIATVCLITTIYLFYASFFVMGYVLGALLATSAFIVSTTDICIPSMIYNFIFRVKLAPSLQEN